VPPSDPDVYDPPQPVPGLAVDHSVLLGRDFLLSGPELERAISFGDSQRLWHQVARLMEGACLPALPSVRLPCPLPAREVFF